jgi:hypothetical protein
MVLALAPRSHALAVLSYSSASLTASPPVAIKIDRCTLVIGFNAHTSKV